MISPIPSWAGIFRRRPPVDIDRQAFAGRPRLGVPGLVVGDEPRDRADVPPVDPGRVRLRQPERPEQDLRRHPHGEIGDGIPAAGRNHRLPVAAHDRRDQVFLRVFGAGAGEEAQQNVPGRQMARTFEIENRRPQHHPGRAKRMVHGQIGGHHRRLDRIELRYRAELRRFGWLHGCTSMGDAFCKRFGGPRPGLIRFEP